MVAVDPDEVGEALGGDAEPISPAPKRKRGKRGICRVCGEPASTERGSYCAEHKPEGGPGRPIDPQPQPRESRPAAETGKRVEGGRPSELETQLRSMLMMAAQVWMVRDPMCGKALMDAAPAIAEYWGNQARTSVRVRRALESLTSSGGILGAIAVHMPVLVVVFGHHVAPALQAAQAGPVVEVPEQPVDVAGDVAATATNGQHPDPLYHPDPFGWDSPDAAFREPGADSWPDAPPSM